MLEQVLWVLTVSIVAVCVILGWAASIVFVRLLFSSPESGGSITRRQPGAFSLPRSNYRPPASLLRPAKPLASDEDDSDDATAGTAATAAQECRRNQANWSNSGRRGAGHQPAGNRMWQEGRMWRRLEARLKARLRDCHNNNDDGGDSATSTDGTTTATSGSSSSNIPLTEPAAIMLQHTYLYDMT